MSLNIVADRNMPLLDELLGSACAVKRLDGRAISAADLREADALLVRSVTKVNAALLAQAERLRFVGTATIGTDHIDRPLLQQRGIAFAHAPGCNAASVADYVSSAVAAVTPLLPVSGAPLASIIGFGQTGSRAARRLHALGYRVQVCDPFMDSVPAPFELVTFEQALRCDVLTLHTPLTREGPHPTWHLFDAARLAALPESLLFINAARGPVVDNAALLALKKQRPHWRLVLDVWEHEPAVDAERVDNCVIATPHIAGYAAQGKQRGSWMVVNALYETLGMQALPAFAPTQQRTLDADAEATLAALLLRAYDIRGDDGRMRQMLAHGGDPEQGFDQLRRDYPVRDEYASICVPETLAQQHAMLSALDFTIR